MVDFLRLSIPWYKQGFKCSVRDLHLDTPAQEINGIQGGSVLPLASVGKYLLSLISFWWCFVLSVCTNTGMALANLLAECIRDSVTSCIREQLFVTCAQKRQVCVWHWNVIGIRQNYQIRMCTKQKGMQSKFQRPKRSSLGIPCLQIVYLFRMLGRKKTLFDRIQDSVS